MKAFICGGLCWQAWTDPFLHARTQGGGDIPALSCGPAPDFPIACEVGIAPVTGKTIAIPMSVATMIWVHFDGQLSVLEGKLSIS